MKHAQPAEDLIRQRRKSRARKRAAAIVLVVSLVLAACGIGAKVYFDHQAAEEAKAQAAQEAAREAFAEFVKSIEEKYQAEKQQALRAQQAAATDEEKWVAQHSAEEKEAIERARQKAIDAAREQAIEEARVAYEAEIEAERARRGSDFSDVFMVGDSVMEYATAQLYATVPGATVNAKGGRALEVGAPGENYDPGDGVLDVLRANSAGYGRYVIGTGNNDPSGLTLDAGEEIVGLLGGDVEIYFITERFNRSPGSMEGTNATIAALCEEHDNVFAVDWHGLTEGREGELLLADSVHPTAAGVSEYTALVHDTICDFQAAPFDPESVEFDPESVEFDSNSVKVGPELTDAIMGKSIISAETMAALYAQRGVEYPSSVYGRAGAASIEDFCRLCVEEADEEGVRAEVLFAQAMHETAWLQFGNQVSVEQNNFGGLGAVNSGGAGEVFPDVRTGLRAQVQHLKAYASTEDVKHEIVDTRFDLVERGCAPTVFDLGGRWAWPGDGYGEAIMGTIQTLYDMEYGSAEGKEDAAAEGAEGAAADQAEGEGEGAASEGEGSSDSAAADEAA